MVIFSSVANYTLYDIGKSEENADQLLSIAQYEYTGARSVHLATGRRACLLIRHYYRRYTLRADRADPVGRVYPHPRE